jgi:excisionase family DNA binding protein
MAAQDCTVKHAAELLGVSVRTIQDWIKQGHFPHAYKLNPQKSNSPYRIPSTDVEQFKAGRSETD